MSRPSASPSPERPASSPAPTAPPAGPESTLQAPARAASAAGATPPEDCMTSGSGSPRDPAASLRSRGSGRAGGEVGVDHGRRAALVLAELGPAPRARPRRGRRAAARSRSGDPPLVRGLEVGEEQADRDRLGTELAASSATIGRSRRRLERLDHALRADPLAALEPRSSPTSGPALARRGGRAADGSGGRCAAGR